MVRTCSPRDAEIRWSGKLPFQLQESQGYAFSRMCKLHVLSYTRACTTYLCPEAQFLSRIVVVRERMQSKEREIHGEWMTEEKLHKSGEFTKQLGANCIYIYT